MSHTLIIGKIYRDCKSKQDSLSNGGPFAFVTKIKHLPGLDFDTVVLADHAKENPDYLRIMKSIDLGIILNDSHTKTNQIEMDIPHTIVEPVEVIVIDKGLNVPEEDFFEKLNEMIETEETSEEIMIDDSVEDEMIDVRIEDIPEGMLIIDNVEYINEEVDLLPESEIKPVNPPRGWHRKAEYIDEIGNIFNTGTYVGNTNEGESNE